MRVAVEGVSEVGPALVTALARLVPQLSRSVVPPGMAELEEIVACPATTLLVARTDLDAPHHDAPHHDAPDRDAPDQGGPDSIVGVLALAVFRIPTGVRAWIEDVVVDDSARGAGVGEALITEALRRAVRAGARTVDLTSRPSREVANRLYRRLGFVPRETNVYRYDQLG